MIGIYSQQAWHHEFLRVWGSCSYHRRGYKGLNNSAFEQFERILDIDYAGLGYREGAWHEMCSLLNVTNF